MLDDKVKMSPTTIVCVYGMFCIICMEKLFLQDLFLTVLSVYYL